MWYYSLNGENFGPISEADLDASIAAGSLPPNVHVWREGMESWIPLNQLRAPAPPAGLRVASAPVSAPPMQVAYASPLAAEEDHRSVQGSSRLEAFSSWGMVVVVGIAMFVFIGILASKPHDARAGVTGVDDADAFDASVRLRSGSIEIKNESDFDWPATTLSFRAGGATYSYKLDSLPRSGKSTVPLGDFANARGSKFNPASSANPREVTISVKGHGSATGRLGSGL